MLLVVDVITASETDSLCSDAFLEIFQSEMELMRYSLSSIECNLLAHMQVDQHTNCFTAAYIDSYT